MTGFGLALGAPIGGSMVVVATGDYAGIASFGGVSHPIWTDRRTGERLNEEVFTATVQPK